MLFNYSTKQGQNFVFFNECKPKIKLFMTTENEHFCTFRGLP